MKHPYILTASQLNIREAFDIKQIVVRNNSAYPVYVNDSSAVPNRNRFDYIAQPNSTFISPALNTKFITVATNALNLPINDIEIIVSDTVDLEAANIPQTTQQFVSLLAGYPVVISQLANQALPTITIDKFQNLFFSVYPKINGSGAIEPSLLSVAYNGYSLANNYFGGADKTGGVISFIPQVVPNVITPAIDFPVAQAANFYEVNVFTTNELIDATVLPIITGGFFSNSDPNPTSQVVYSYIIPPAVIISVSVLEASGLLPVTVNLDVKIEVSTGFFKELYSANYTNTFTPNRTYALRPKLFLTNEISFAKITMTHHTSSTNYIVYVNMIPVG